MSLGLKITTWVGLLVATAVAGSLLCFTALRNLGQGDARVASRVEAVINAWQIRSMVVAYRDKRDGQTELRVWSHRPSAEPGISRLRSEVRTWLETERVPSALFAEVDALLNAASARLIEERLKNETLRRKANRVIRIATLTGIGLLVLGLGYFFPRILLPISRLAKLVKRLRAGEWSARWSGGGEPEIADIGRTLDAMSDEIVAQRQLRAEFIGSVAHELKSPLTTISMYCELGRREDDGQRYPLIQEQARHVSRLVDDLLATSRESRPAWEIHKERVSLRQITAETVSSLTSRLADRRLEFRASGDPWVSADRGRIAQVLGNLISNAAKYSPAGAPIEIQVREEGGEPVVNVSDLGPGIEPLRVEALFKPFSRLRETRSLAPGTGLGLWIVRQIMIAHGGSVSVSPRNGGGSVFSIRFPAEERRKRGLAAACFLAAALLTSGTTARAETELRGAGATFPYPLYQKWISEFEKANAGVKITYESTGSGQGIEMLRRNQVDFAGSDVPSPDRYLSLPTVVGAVAVTYNLPGLSRRINLTPDAIADLFLGRIKRWDDERIARINPGLVLPAIPVTVVHRADGSGTTGIFSEYLSKVSPEWRRRVGSGLELKWPTGIAGRGNEGLAGQVKETLGSVGYVELIYAEMSGLPYAAVRNRAGRFVVPETPSIGAAASEAAKAGAESLTRSITDPQGGGAYPICGMTFILVRPPLPPEKARILRTFFHWMLDKGSATAQDLLYVPLPGNVARKVEAQIDEIRGD